MVVESGSEKAEAPEDRFLISSVQRLLSEPSEADRPFLPLVGGPRLFVLLLYASVLVAASLEFFSSQRIWYGSWEVYNTYVFTVTGVFVFLGMIMLLMSKKNGTDGYGLPVPRLLLGTSGFVMFAFSGLALVVIQWRQFDEIWAIPLSITLLYGFLLMLLGGRGFNTHDSLRLTLYGTGLVFMILVPVHESFGLGRSAPGDYPFTLVNLVLLTVGMVLALVAIQSINTRDGFVGAWLLGAMAIFLIAFHEQLGIVASGNYSPYDRALALIGITFSILPLVMYVWRERVYIFLWRRLSTTNSLIERGDYENALKQADAAIRQCSRVGIEDRFALPWSLKADAHYRMKEYEKAMVHYETALKIDPKDSASWCHLGNMYALQGKQEAALKAFDEALKVDPANGYAWNNKGAVYQQLGMYEDALICFDKAIGYESDGFDAHINSAKLLSKMGHSSEALRHYRAAAAMRPQSQIANEGVRREFHRSMCLDQIAGWEQLGLDTSQLRQILDQDPQHFVRRSKEFLKNIVEERKQLPVVPGKEHIDVNAAIQTILLATEAPEGATLDKIKEETGLRENDLILPLALLMETDHVHFKTVGKRNVYVSKGKAPDKPPPEPKPVEAPKPVHGAEPKEHKVSGKPPVAAPAKVQTVEIKCPGCGLVVTGDEVKCPRCDLPFETASFDCPICGEEVEFSSRSCPKCGAVFRGTPAETAPPAPEPGPTPEQAQAVEPAEKERPRLWPRRKAKPAARRKKPKAAPPEEKKEPKRRTVVTVEPTASILVFRRRKK
jgi:tetratricopeptide (TPR) repeat protein